MSLLEDLERKTAKAAKEKKDADDLAAAEAAAKKAASWEEKSQEALKGLKKALKLDLGEYATELMPKFPKDLWKGHEGNWSYTLTIVLPNHTFIQRHYREEKTISQLYGSRYDYDWVIRNEYNRRFKILPETGWMVERWEEAHYNNDSTYDEGPSVSHYTYHDWRVAFCEIDPKVLDEKDGRYTSFLMADDLGTALMNAAEYYTKYYIQFSKDRKKA